MTPLDMQDFVVASERRGVLKYVVFRSDAHEQPAPVAQWLILIFSTSRKSTSGTLFMMNGGAISWRSRKQTVVATSSCEAEYLALTEACKEAAWLRRIVADVIGHTDDPTLRLDCDNTGTISLAQNESINRRNKHIDIAFHFVRDAVSRKIVTLSHCPSTEMPADILTKPLGRILFEKFVDRMGLASLQDA